MRPRSELVRAPVITTSTKRPTSRGWPGKFTERMFLVFPVSSLASLRDGPVTSIFCALPTIACEVPAESRSEEHTSEPPPLMRRSDAVVCLKEKDIRIFHEPVVGHLTVVR